MYEGIIDPDNPPREFLEPGMPAIFFRRPTPDMIISVAPQVLHHRRRFVEDKKTGLFYALAAWIPRTIVKDEDALEFATYKIKGGG